MVSVSPFINAAGASIKNSRIYYEHYVAVSAPSEWSPYPPGRHPDALVPVSKNDSFLRPITKIDGDGRINQPFWVDVQIPAEATPGIYRAEFSIQHKGGTRFTLPIVLEVWDFELPSRVSLASAFDIDKERLEKLYGFDRGTVPYNRVMRAYEDLLADHQLAAEGYWGTLEAVDEHSGRVSLERGGQPGLGEPVEVFSHFLDKKGLRSAIIPLWPDWPFPDALGRDRDAAKRYVASYVRQLAEEGWAEYVYTDCAYIDEPSTRAEYQEVRAWGRFYNEVEAEYGVKIPMMVTEQPESDSWMFGSLHGYVDIWVTHVGDLWEDQHGKGNGVVGQRLAEGDRLWLYTAMTGIPGSWMKANGHPDTINGSNPPVWLIDYAPMNYRVWSWMADIYQADGVLYWATIDWRDGVDPWQDAGSLEVDGGIFNGDGQLIYPGYRREVGFDGPVASMRLKWIREAMDDHAYLQLLRERGLGREAEALRGQLVRGVGDWDNEPARLFEIREQMAELLQSETNS